MNMNDDSSSDWSSSGEDEYEEGDFLVSYSSICNPSEKFSTIEECLTYDLENHNFSILEYIETQNKDDEWNFYTNIRLLNFSRKCVHDFISADDNKNVGEKLKNSIETNRDIWASSIVNDNDENDESCSGENLFKPVIEADGFLVNMEEVIVMAVDSQRQDTNKADNEVHIEDRDEQVDELKAELSALKAQLKDARLFIAEKFTNVKDESKIASHKGMRMEKSMKSSSQIATVDNDSYYFKSYSHYGIHEQMLKDTVRTGAYERAIMENPTLFHGKTVLDVGCGTGVLSIFAAKAGAKKVVSVDDSDIVNQARKIIEKNGFDKVITLVKGKVEDVNLPLKENEVDIIISEWMGYALFFETMLPSVLSARDRFMAASGTMFPNACQIFLEGGSDDRLDFWDDVHGIDMTAMREIIELELTSEAQVSKFDASSVVTERIKLVDYDLNTCLDEELDFKAPFTLKLRQGIDRKKIDVLVISFDIDFSKDCANVVSFSTGCQSAPTHWYQTVLWLEPRVAPTMVCGESLVGTFRMSRNVSNPREMDFHVLWQVVDKDNKIRADGSIRSHLGAEN